MLEFQKYYTVILSQYCVTSITTNGGQHALVTAELQAYTIH